eukprot:CAMPEP_0117780866 /NCGR_PEP_ID=MMETSP0948-20121206/2492_1 /TAXON_ID=44440 /ORGANISM="Chattonella subsalsa, Strain CCMP2191" /LENGTH=376 /DNA_ID=CAMNT_0005608761 /DNA_START=16 /DNA_END=1146 /DNA_ORIENTATION=+
MRNRIQVEAEQRQALSDVKWLWEGIQIPGDDSWQFRAKQKYGPLVPPLDIAWVWYLHRLDPVAYHDCCQNYFGQTIDAGRGAAEDGGSVIAALAFDSGHHRSSALTRVIWGALYLREPFYPPVDRQRQITEINGDLLDATEGKDMDGTKRNSLVQRLASHKEKADFMTALEFDFESAAETQRRFFEQIMSRWKMYSSKVWLVEAVKRYHNWLQVQADLLESDPARAGQLVAPMDIALMWHAHMACNWAYEKECRTVLELDGLIPHDHQMREILQIFRNVFKSQRTFGVRSLRMTTLWVLSLGKGLRWPLLQHDILSVKFFATAKHAKRYGGRVKGQGLKKCTKTGGLKANTLHPGAPVQAFGSGWCSFYFGSLLVF